jgi:hypothetical protein
VAIIQELYNQREFEILIRQKIPFLTKTTWIGIILLFAILTLLWVYMAPAIDSRSSTEMKTAYFMLAVPDWLKYISVIAVLGLFILLPLNSIRRNIPSQLTFDTDTVILSNKHLDQIIKNQKINKVLFNDLKDYSGFPKGKLQIAIHIYGDRIKDNKIAVFSLLNYEDGGGVIDCFEKIPNLEIKFYDTPFASYLD